MTKSENWIKGFIVFIFFFFLILIIMYSSITTLGIADSLFLRNTPIVTSNVWLSHVVDNTVNNFTIDSGGTLEGDLSTINVTDGNILNISDQPGNTWQFNFSCLGFNGNKPASIEFNGWQFIGNHDIKLKCWNGTAEEDVTDDSNDFPALGVRTTSNFPLIGNRSIFSNGGAVNCSVNHVPPGAGNHIWSVDSIHCESANIEFETAGSFVNVTEYSAEITKNIETNLTTGILTILYPGLYDALYSHSFSGSPSETFEMRIFVNDVQQGNTHSTRGLNSAGSIGNMGNSGASTLNLSVGDNVTLGISCSIGDCYVSSEEIMFKLERD